MNTRFAIFLALAASIGFPSLVPAGEDGKVPSERETPLGSPAFMPSPERPVGWRGDGTSRFPGATPPVEWHRRRTPDGQLESRNIAWMARLPSAGDDHWGASGPVIVGENIYVSCHWNSLACYRKKDGRLLWIRSLALPLNDKERQALGDQAAKADDFDHRLAANGESLADLISAGISTTAPTNGASVGARIAERQDLEKKALEWLRGLDTQKYGDLLARADGGYNAPTPCSDGQSVCVYFANGVVGGFDLQGQRKWIKALKHGSAEHGNYYSPVMGAGIFMVSMGSTVTGIDIRTGETKWEQKYIGHYPFARCRLGQEVLAVSGHAAGFKLADGTPLAWKPQVSWAQEWDGPTIEGRTLYYLQSIGIHESFGLISASLPEQSSGGVTWPKIIPSGIKEAKSGLVVASPLYHDGLVYGVNEPGFLAVFDPQAGAMVYTRKLPLEPDLNWVFNPGVCASPMLGGAAIYIFDNRGKAVVFAPGRTYRELAVNRIEPLDPKAREQFLSNPVCDGTRLYLRGNQHLYCLGQM